MHPMNFSFSPQRLWLLLRYDFVQARRNLWLIAAVIIGVYIVVIYRPFTQHVNSWTPLDVANTCHELFTMARYLCLILVTLMLHRKFTNPASAPGYITLPASTLEKFCALLLDYIAVYVGIYAAEWVCYYASMWLGAMLLPELVWSRPFATDGDNVESFFRTLSIETLQLDFKTFGFEHAQAAATTCYVSWWLATWLYFICLNFHFRRNGILKSCLTLLLTYIVLTFLLGPLCAMWLSSYLDSLGELTDTRLRQVVAPQVMSLLRATYVLMWCSPLVPLGVAARLYWLVSRKQIK
jgi:hypothetical protein